ncbi:Acyl-coenzyme A:6-aminopenicillanic acid acyl-transferase subfamily [Sulfitobacter noctilucicola]|uniref:Putative choloylglycine hydrolase n=1 Tax=Sulfitobacter noctilucicola TaxID=1342301 RepID=A0A7W6M9G9_9RHOB|nr:C45 family peptidase [Sulfitobacter noctilucicola]KIN63755.1 Acyl-coenzyme A:6-aminopenicillanic acid acyl-transferase subfamily [Sulfitobacter noctilucicola]MBB4174736.1 putative choloylglycine hydrolase [Sulfitobacter noctilucicola]
MTYHSLTFDAVSEATPGPKWAARWARSWPAYEPWFVARGGDAGPSRQACAEALESHMPELVETYDRLVAIAGGGDRAARFLSTWCPPSYLGGCSLACAVSADDIRLVRNYDLSPDLNEGLLLHTAWRGKKVMGMVEFLWGLSDGINEAGLSIALAYGGRQETGEGFGITTILRYVLETCENVDDALAALHRVPSHMCYNILVADAGGNAASVEVYAGGGAKEQPLPIATNHQNDGSTPDRGDFTQTHKRAAHLKSVLDADPIPASLVEDFLAHPLRQDRYGEGFGTLFTAEYKPRQGAMMLHWQGENWTQSLDSFYEGQRVITYGGNTAPTAPLYDIDWVAIGQAYARGDYPDWRSFVSGWSNAA